MNRTLLLLQALVAPLVAPVLADGPPKATEPRTAKAAGRATTRPAERGFRPMFNGKDLTGWKTTGNWVVEPGNVIALKPRPGEQGWQRYDAYLTTDRMYGDFILDLEFKFTKGGNSGVFLRVADPKSQVKTGFEIQILDTHGKKKFGAHDCGGVIGTAAPAKMAVKPAGEWNRYIISCIGSHLTVKLNGEGIIDLDLSKTGLKDRPMKGYIGFQDEAKHVWYRNVRIKEIPTDAEFEALGEEMLDALRAKTEVLKSIKDQASAKAARPKLLALMAKRKDIERRGKRLDALMPQEQLDRLKKKFGKRVKAALKEMFSEVERVGKLGVELDANQLP